jgi:hypothetical protein
MVLPNPALTTAIQNGTQDTAPLYLAGEFTGTDNGSGDSSQDSMEFYTIGSDGTPDVLHSEGMRDVQIGISTDSGQPNLVRQVTRNLLAPTPEDPDQEVLCPNVKSFSLRYFDGSDWYDDWDSSSTDTPNQLPMMIEMIIVLNVPDLQMPNEEPNTYRITRLIPLPLGTMTTTTTNTPTPTVP